MCKYFPELVGFYADNNLYIKKILGRVEANAKHHVDAFLCSDVLDAV